MKLRPYQSEAVDAVFSYLSAESGNPCVTAATGSGKSLIIAAIIAEAFRQYSEVRIMVVSHITEILLQNHEKLQLLMRSAPAGMYSATLKKRQFVHPIVFGGIQSVYNKAHLFGYRNIILIDEAHAVMGKDKGMYGKFIADMKAINPNVRFVALTATDYRSSGLLTEVDDRIFTNVVYEILAKYLIDEGYLTPPIGKHLKSQADMTGVKMLGDDFNQKQMAARFSKLEFIEAAIAEDLPYLEGRKGIAIFCPTIEIADHVAICMNKHGITCEAMHGDMTDDFLNNKNDIRTDKLRRFKSGELRALSSVGMITTGVDVPTIDCLILFFATESAGLYEQVLGRGFRVVYADGYDLDERDGRLAAIANGTKPNFMVLDHGGNISRHGGVTNIQKPQKREKGQRKPLPKAKIRVCEACRTANTLEALNCILCGSELKIERDPTKSLSITASDADIMGTPFSRGEIAEWFKVDDVRYMHHVKSSGDSLRVTYYCGIMIFDEYKAMSWISGWWRLRTDIPVPKTVPDAMNYSGQLKMPIKVQVRKKGAYYEVLKYEFGDNV